MKILSVIPARGGSKGIPKKNIKDLCGKPLIAHTIEASLKCDKTERTIVSTDDTEIANISKKFGADVPFLRPAHLALDTTPSIDVLLHCLNYLQKTEGYVPDYVCLLQCTSPLRTEEHIYGAINIVPEKNAESVVSVCESSDNPYWAKIINRDGKISNLMGQEKTADRRQDLPTVYKLNGAIYLNKTSMIQKVKQFVTDQTYPYIMDKRSSVDIDDNLDFDLVRFILSNK